MDDKYFCHKSTGTLCFDPKQGTKHFEDWWAIVFCDNEIVRYYCWHLQRWGRPVVPNKLWNAHISAIKGERPLNKSLWGGKMYNVEFWYAHTVRMDNKKHAWVDVYSPQLRQIRIDLGLKVERDRFHMTIGMLQ